MTNSPRISKQIPRFPPSCRRYLPRGQQNLPCEGGILASRRLRHPAEIATIDVIPNETELNTELN
jgi:hypothetical protein